MKFKLVEKFDETRSIVQEYMYDAMDELNNASLEEYIQWFKDNLTAYSEDIEQAVTDAYIEACDYGMIKGVEKTKLTSELKEYIESHKDIIDDTDELMKQCPEHLKHELNIVLSKLDESLNESVLEEAIRPDLKRFIEQHAELLDENNIEELYKQCPQELKIPLVRMLNAASLNNIESIKRATFLADFYDDDELIKLVLSVGEHANDVFDAFDYIINNWDEFFTDDVLNEELLTENKNGATDKPVSLRSLLDTALGWRLLKQLCSDETFKYGFTLSSNKRGQGGNQDNPLHHIMGTWDVDKTAELSPRHHTQLHNRVRNVLISKLTSELDLSDLYKMYCSAFDGKPLSEKNLVKRFRAYEDFFRGLAKELQRINFYDCVEPTYVEQWDQMVSELS